MEIIWTESAFESLYNIVEYVQYFFGENIAKDVTQKIYSHVEMLGKSPQIGKQLTHLSQYGEIRCTFYKRNHVYYQLLERKVIVLLIWDGRQAPARLRSLLQESLSKSN